MLNIDVTKKCLVAQGWCPVFATDQVISRICHTEEIIGLLCLDSCRVSFNEVVFNLQIQSVLLQATSDSNSQVGVIFQVLRSQESPPTFFRTNKVTSAFQEIVDAYG